MKNGSKYACAGLLVGFALAMFSFVISSPNMLSAGFIIAMVSIVAINIFGDRV